MAGPDENAGIVILVQPVEAAVSDMTVTGALDVEQVFVLAVSDVAAGVWIEQPLAASLSGSSGQPGQLDAVLTAHLEASAALCGRLDAQQDCSAVLAGGVLAGVLDAQQDVMLFADGLNGHACVVVAIQGIQADMQGARELLASIDLTHVAAISAEGCGGQSAVLSATQDLQAKLYGGRLRAVRRCLVLHPHRGGFTSYDDFGFDRFFRQRGVVYGLRDGTTYRLDAQGVVTTRVRTGKLATGTLANLPFAYAQGAVPTGATLRAITEGGASDGALYQRSQNGQTLRAQFGRGLRGQYWQIELTIKSSEAWRVDDIAPVFLNTARRIGK